MKIMTYNVQSGRDAWGQLHLDGCCETINKVAPDLCGLNEIRVGCSDSENLDQAAYIAEKTGMKGFFAKAIPLGDGDYGIALLSRYPVREFAVHPVPDVPQEEREKGYYENRVIYRAVVETDEGALAVYGSHFGLTRPERRYAVKMLKELLKSETLPTVFMGDLNMTPDNELIGEIRAQLTDLTKPIPDYTAHTLNLKETIDYIFVKGLRAAPAQAVYSFASDHLPIFTDAHIL